MYVFALLNHCKLQPEIATCNVTSATCNGFSFPTLRDKLQEKLHRVIPALELEAGSTFATIGMIFFNHSKLQWTMPLN